MIDINATIFLAK